jgi:thymidylate synthase ThyX
VVAAALLHRVARRSFAECRRAADGLDRQQLAELFVAAMRRMEFFDGPLREFEHATLTFDLVVSASCFAQLKRHRMSTQTWQAYDPALGLTIPPSVVEAGRAEQFEEHARRAAELHERLVDEHPAVAPYVLTNGHRRRVLLTANLRELYHLIRLREDHHAQWDIRNVAGELRRATEEALPLGSLLLCGKDGFVERFTRVFGEPPAIDPAELDP